MTFSPMVANKRIFSGLWVGLILLLSACVVPHPQGVVRTPPVVALPDTASAGNLEYKIAVGDELEIRFSDRADMTQTLRVQPDGHIAPANLGAVQAAGRTVTELTADLKKVIEQLQTARQADNASPRYVLSVGDDLEIRFTYYNNLNQLARIRPDGRISLPYIKSIAAEGMTPEDFESELIRRYAEYLKRPDLTLIVRAFTGTRVRIGDRLVPAGLINGTPSVSLRSFGAPQIFIAGEVTRPGVLNYRSSMTLLQSIVEAGGYKPSGEMRSVIVLRKSSSGEGLMIRRDLLADLAGGDTNDIPLEASDIVVVPKTAIASVAEIIDQYLYQTIAPLRNSSFGFVYNLKPNSTVTVK